MGDFFVPGGGFTPPTEPDTPTPDFVKAGLNWNIGVSQGKALWGWAQAIIDVVLKIIATFVGWILGLAGQLLAYIIRNISEADEAAQAGYSDLIASELQSLFGFEYNSAALQGVSNAKSRADLGDKVGAAILQNIFAPAGGAGGSGIEPNDQGAKKFLGAVMTMEVEGWFHAWLFDALSYHELEKFGELKDGIARTLGLGRMSRQVFSPPLRVFVHDPYLAKLNEAYRPEHLAPASAIRQFFRGELTREQLSVILGRQGIREQYIDFMVNEHQKYLSDNDVDYLVSRSTWTLEQGVKYLAEQGWDTGTAERRLAIMHDQRIDRYRREIVAAGSEAFLRGEIPSDQLRTIVQASGLSDDEQTWLMRVAGTKRELHATHLSRGDIERLIKEGILNFNDLQQWAIRNQMPIDEERLLELGLAVEEVKSAAAVKAKAEAAKAKAAAEQHKTAEAVAKAAHALAQAPDKGISVSEAETLVMDGTWTFQHFSNYLAARDYSPDAITALSHLLHAKIDKLGGNQAAAGAAHAGAGGKSLTVSEMERAAVDGLISIEELARYLAGAGYAPHDVTVLVELTQHQIDQQKLKDQAAAAARQRAGGRGISLADIERAVRLGLTPLATYTKALQDAGYDPTGIALLEGILKAAMAADQAAAAKRGAANAAAGAQGLSLTELEQAVINGLRPIGDYTAALVKLGYGSADAGDLTKLLQLRVDQAKATAAHRAAAGAATAQRGLSLADVERAVKLGVLKLADYTAALKAASFDQHSIDVLTNSLKTQIGSSAAAQTAANSAAGKLKAKGISLLDEERAVLAGIKPITDYTALLRREGYNAADSGVLTRLLQDKIDQQELAQSRHADALGIATERGIGLAQEEAAVVDGTLSMEDYDSLLIALGYDQVDRSILESLLLKRVQAAAAKAGATTASTDGGNQTT